MTSVLVVEDNTDLSYQLWLELTMQGYSVSTASDGQEGLKRLNETPPQIIVSDINMPNMDGFEFYKAVRDNHEWVSIPFIFLTARDSQTDLEQGYGLGADDYIVKPFKIEHLLRVINAKLKRQEMLRATFDAQKAAIEQAKRELTRMVAHELRTPLVSINLVLEIIGRQMGKLSEVQMNELLTTLNSGSKRMNRLVDQVVLLTQIESGALSRQSIRETSFPKPFQTIVTAAITRGKTLASRPQNSTVTLKNTDINPMILCDSRALEHAIAEIIANALTFSPAEADVVVTMGKNESIVWLRVNDCGRGMTPEQVEQALQMFQQINREQVEQQGMGLGLSLAHGIVSAHGGSLEITSTPEVGTQVTIQLPIVVKA